MSENPSIERVERAYAEQRGVSRRAARESVQQGISALIVTHDIGYRAAIALFAQKHGLDVSVVADRRRRGALPIFELVDAGQIQVGDKLRGFTQKTGAISGWVGPGNTIAVDGAHYPGPIEAIAAVGGHACGVAAWQKWQHERTRKTLLQLGVELLQKESQE